MTYPTIAAAVDALVQCVRDTGKPLAEAAREVFPAPLTIPDELAYPLLIEALSARAGTILRNPFFDSQADAEEKRGALTVSVRAVEHPKERFEVTCRVLQDTVYHVNGVAKPIAVFTRFDVSTKLESVRRVEAGVTRHRQMWEYVLGRMNACKKERVEDLAEGEQIKIARMIFDLRQQKEPAELEN